MLIADLKRKVVFMCHMIDDNIADSDDNTANYGDCERCYNKANIIIKGFSLNLPVEFKVKPSIYN